MRMCVGVFAHVCTCFCTRVHMHVEPRIQLLSVCLLLDTLLFLELGCFAGLGVHQSVWSACLCPSLPIDGVTGAGDNIQLPLWVTDIKHHTAGTLLSEPPISSAARLSDLVINCVLCSFKCAFY